MQHLIQCIPRRTTNGYRHRQPASRAKRRSACTALFVGMNSFKRSTGFKVINAWRVPVAPGKSKSGWVASNDGNRNRRGQVAGVTMQA